MCVCIYIYTYTTGKEKEKKKTEDITLIFIISIYIIMKNHFVGLLSVLFTCFILGTKITYANKTPSPVRLIIDTDAGFDVDDIGAITVANALEDLGEVEIIAISHTNGYTKGIGAVSTIMNFYGRNDVPLGAYKGPWARNATYGNNTADKYISDLTNNWPSPIKNSTEVLIKLDGTLKL